MLKTVLTRDALDTVAYHLGEGRVLKTARRSSATATRAYHLGEGRVLKTHYRWCRTGWIAYHLGEGACSRPDNQGTFVQAKSIGFGRMYVQGDSLQLEDPVISIAVMWKLEIGKRI